MNNIQLYQSANHRFVLLNESESGDEAGVHSNQYLIEHQGHGVLLDPGGFGVMPRVLAELLKYIPPDQVQAIILSHQDPDIVGGISTWLEMIKAPVYVSHIWMRFLPHYGLQDMSQFRGVPDAGQSLTLAPGFELKIVPAHFLHSEGQINVYDPVSRILFTGDIGSAMMPSGMERPFVDDFQAHLPHIHGFHQRYMCGQRAVRCWLDTIADLDIEMLAPQHGPIYRGRAVLDFLEWIAGLRCGLDLLQPGGRFAA